MYHPKGEMKVSVMIVYVHKAWHQTEKSTIEPERYLWYIWYALPLKISIYYDIRERCKKVVNAIDLYIDDRTLHEWIHRRDVGYPRQLILQVCRYDRLYVNQTLCLYMTTTSSINSPYCWVCRCCNIKYGSNCVDWILMDRWKIWVWPGDFGNSRFGEVSKLYVCIPLS